jgi:hypothetical protein
LRGVGFILLVALSAEVGAEQLQFEKLDLPEDIELVYKWPDHGDNIHDLTVTLSKKFIQQQFRKIKAYMPDIAQRYIYVELQKQAQLVDPREARVRIHKLGKDIRVSVTSRSDRLIKKWQDTMEVKQKEAFDHYLQENYYSHYTSYLGQEGVKPDHLRYARESMPALVPIAQSLYQQLPADSESRAYINLILSWIQSIPYNALQDRLVSNGSGYSSPVEVLLNNIGDCDSKTTLMAAMLRLLMPELSMVIIYLPDHALLGAILPHRSNEELLTINGSEYLLIEPTGPAMMSAGNVGKHSANGIASGMYSFEVVP